MRDLHLLPKVRDSLSFLYVEHARIEQDEQAVAVYDADGKTPVPCTALTTLLLGPGTTITHAAIKTLGEAGCLVLWTGEAGVRLYAQGLGETRSSRLLQQQVRLWADPAGHEIVVRRMYELRFGESVPPTATLQQIRGREGIRVRRTYEEFSRATGVPWTARAYSRGRWDAADPVNRALSAANACLYGVCHSAILSLGCSPALGFIHTGRQLSFVYDIADLYKTEFTIPAAFRVVAEGDTDVERRARRLVRDVVTERQLLRRIVPDLQALLELGSLDEAMIVDPDADTADLPPGGLWDPDGELDGGVNWGGDAEGTS
jgi:CRISPR-associated protein Cas1